MSNLYIQLEEKIYIDDKEDEAKKFWADINFLPYIKKQKFSISLAKIISSFNPKTVFEFGCNAGRNLCSIIDIDKNIVTYGVDININAIEYARGKNLNVVVGDEKCLNIIPNNTYDICFTCSVINHLPNPLPVIFSLFRISRCHLLLLEPFCGEEGKILKNYHKNKKIIVDSTPFSYSWNYQKIISENLSGYKLTAYPFPLPTSLGDFYQLFHVEKIS